MAGDHEEVRSCAHFYCGADFTPRQDYQKYCSEQCQRRSSSLRYCHRTRGQLLPAAVQTQKSCPHCGQDFLPYPGQVHQKYCSKRCQRRAHESRRYHRRNPGYIERSRQRKNEKNRERRAERRANNFCIICAAPLADRPGQTRLCSALCREQHRLNQHPPAPPRPLLTEEQRRANAQAAALKAKKRHRKRMQSDPAYAARHRQHRRDRYHRLIADPSFRAHVNRRRRIAFGDPIRAAKERERHAAENQRRRRETEIIHAVSQLWLTPRPTPRPPAPIIDLRHATAVYSQPFAFPPQQYLQQYVQPAPFTLPAAPYHYQHRPHRRLSKRQLARKRALARKRRAKRQAILQTLRELGWLDAAGNLRGTPVLLEEK